MRKTPRNAGKISVVTWFAISPYNGGAAHEPAYALLKNSSSLGAPYIHGEYSSALFEDYVQPGGELGYNYKNVKSTDKACCLSYKNLMRQ